MSNKLHTPRGRYAPQTSPVPAPTTVHFRLRYVKTVQPGSPTRTFCSYRAEAYPSWHWMSRYRSPGLGCSPSALIAWNSICSVTRHSPFPFAAVVVPPAGLLDPIDLGSDAVGDGEGLGAGEAVVGGWMATTFGGCLMPASAIGVTIATTATATAAVAASRRRRPRRCEAWRARSCRSVWPPCSARSRMV